MRLWSSNDSIVSLPSTISVIAHGTSKAIQGHRNRHGGWNSIENMKPPGAFGLRRKAIGRLLFPIDRHFSIDSGLKRWGREDLRSGSRLLPERRANFPDRSWFPSIVSRTFKNALPTGKSISAGESDRARFLRRISWARIGDNGWFDFSEMRVLVFFLSRKYFTTMEVGDLGGGGVHKNFSR